MALEGAALTEPTLCQGEATSVETTTEVVLEEVVVDNLVMVVSRGTTLNVITAVIGAETEIERGALLMHCTTPGSTVITAATTMTPGTTITTMEGEGEVPRLGVTVSEEYDCILMFVCLSICLYVYSVTSEI